MLDHFDLIASVYGRLICKPDTGQLEKLLLMHRHFFAPEKIRDRIAGHGYPAAIENDGRCTAWIVVDTFG